MRLPVDDRAWWVDSIYLGPKGHTLPWTARYISYGIGAVVMVTLIQIERTVGITTNLNTYLLNLLVTILVTKAISRFVDHDRPLRSVLVAFGREVIAPRTKPTPPPAAFAVERIRFH